MAVPKNYSAFRQTAEQTDRLHTNRFDSVKSSTQTNAAHKGYLMFSMLPFSSLRVEHVLNRTGRKTFVTLVPNKRTIAKAVLFVYWFVNPIANNCTCRLCPQVAT